MNQLVRGAILMVLLAALQLPEATLAAPLPKQAQEKKTSGPKAEKKPTSEKKQENNKVTKLQIKVLAIDSTEPVPSAQVDVMSEDPSAPYHKNGRTNQAGMIEVDVPSVQVVVQVTAQHFDTAGVRLSLQGEHEKIVEIKLKKR
ncbi:MAG TPA: hypothetical protein VF532_10245 [Candidatus Angelobacter sp.]